MHDRNSSDDGVARLVKGRGWCLWALMIGLAFISLACVVVVAVATWAISQNQDSHRIASTPEERSIVLERTKSITALPRHIPFRQPTTPHRVYPVAKVARTPTPKPRSNPTRLKPTPAATPLPPEQVRADLPHIQRLLGSYLRAQYTGSTTNLRGVLDRKNLDWVAVANRHIQESTLRNDSIVRIKSRITSVSPQLNGYYRVSAQLTYIFNDNRRSRAMEDYTFRYLRGEWLVAEPRKSQLGHIHTLTRKGVSLRYYSWDAWQARTILKELQKAVRYTSRVLRIKAQGRVVIHLIPSYSVLPYGMSYEQDGFYPFFDRRNIYLRSPGTEGFGSYGLDAPSQRNILVSTAEHETTHLLQDQVVDLSQLPGWMSEGLAGWVSHEDRHFTLIRAIRSHHLLRVGQLQDNFAMLPSSDVLTAYAESEDMVDYIVETRGVKTYWVLVKTYERTGSVSSAFRRAMGISPAVFQQRWERWVRNKYRADLRDAE